MTAAMDDLSGLLSSAAGAGWKECAEAYTKIIGLVSAESIEPAPELAVKARTQTRIRTDT